MPLTGRSVFRLAGLRATELSQEIEPHLNANNPMTSYQETALGRVTVGVQRNVGTLQSATQDTEHRYLLQTVVHVS